MCLSWSPPYSRRKRKTVSALILGVSTAAAISAGPAGIGAAEASAVESGGTGSDVTMTAHILGNVGVAHTEKEDPSKLRGYNTGDTPEEATEVNSLGAALYIMFENHGDKPVTVELLTLPEGMVTIDGTRTIDLPTTVEPGDSTRFYTSSLDYVTLPPGLSPNEITARLDNGEVISDKVYTKVPDDYIFRPIVWRVEPGEIATVSLAYSSYFIDSPYSPFYAPRAHDLVIKGAPEWFDPGKDPSSRMNVVSAEPPEGSEGTYKFSVSYTSSQGKKVETPFIIEVSTAKDNKFAVEIPASQQDYEKQRSGAIDLLKSLTPPDGLDRLTPQQLSQVHEKFPSAMAFINNENPPFDTLGEPVTVLGDTQRSSSIQMRPSQVGDSTPKPTVELVYDPDDPAMVELSDKQIRLIVAKPGVDVGPVKYVLGLSTLR